MARPSRCRLTLLGALLVLVAMTAAGCAGATGPLPRGFRHPSRARPSPSATSTSSISASGGGAPSVPPPAGTQASPLTSPPAPAGAAGADWPTYHHDLARSGAVASGPSPAIARVRWAVPVPGPGAVQAEPLVVGGEVLVATEGDTVVAFSATSGARRWETTLGQPVPGSALPCGDIDPSGITGTPVVDVARGLVWVVAFVRPGRHLLVALSLGTGRVVSRRVVDPPGASPLVEQQRGALALSGGLVDIPYGGLYGDCGDYHGYVVGAAEDGSGPLRSFRVSAAHQGGIWAPSGPAVDAAGDLLVATGNASPPGGNTVIRLTPGLARVDSFAPTDAVAMDLRDLDLGSTGPILLPGGLVFQVGKTGVGYLLQADHLGGPGGQRQEIDVCAAAFGGDAWSRGMVYVPCVDGIVALRLGAASLSVAWRSASFAAGSPVVAGSTLWALDPSRGVLLGLDAVTGAQLRALAVGTSARFATPAVGGSQLYLAAGGRLVDVGS